MKFDKKLRYSMGEDLMNSRQIEVAGYLKNEKKSKEGICLVVLKCFSRYSGHIFAAFLSFFALSSPLIMVILPKILSFSWRTDDCEEECESLLMSLGCKLALLSFACFLLLLRPPTSNMPRIFTFRALIFVFLFILIFSHWLFYAVKLWSIKSPFYEGIVVFATNMTDCLLLTHYLAVVLIEFRYHNNLYMIKMVRSPDGSSFSFCVGQLSVQRLALLCLQRYQVDFTQHNPFLQRMLMMKRSRGSRTAQFKINREERDQGEEHDIKKEINMVNSGLIDVDKMQERKERRRRMRLLVGVEDAFRAVRGLQGDQASQTLFATIASPLQKYLRATRQQPFHSKEQILHHIRLSLALNISPKVFIERFLPTNCVAACSSEKSQNWIIFSNSKVNSPIKSGLNFSLKKENISLYITVSCLPYLCFSLLPSPSFSLYQSKASSETQV